MVSKYRVGKPAEPVENRVVLGVWGVVYKFVQIFRSKETMETNDFPLLCEALGPEDNSC